MSTKYAHTNLVAKDWKRLSIFYQKVFGCVPIPPERDLSGEWLDKATGLGGSHICGMHLRLPGYGDDAPTLELFQYGSMPEHPSVVRAPPDSRISPLQSMTFRIQCRQFLPMAVPQQVRLRSGRYLAWGC